MRKKEIVSQKNIILIQDDPVDAEQLTFLQEHSCPEGQGYYFSHLVVAGQLAQLLGNNLTETA
jgi:EAL domain-containing protein (putative c-di-GMP-specific phosphodiesterase class I)